MIRTWIRTFPNVTGILLAVFLIAIYYAFL